MEPWTVIDEERVLDGVRPVARRRYRRPQGEDPTIDVTLEGPSAVVLALTEDGDVILVRQFRPGPGRVMFDLPAGFLDGDEPPDEGARRELREETGFVAAELVAAGTTTPSAYSDEVRNVFVARGCTRGALPDTDETEELEVVLVSVPQLRALLRSGELVTADAAYLALDVAGLLGP